ncbi:MAG: hypothetical protein WC346_04005 [Methanogenium sp.]|jgi:hypothetical protein
MVIAQFNENTSIDVLIDYEIKKADKYVIAEVITGECVLHPESQAVINANDAWIDMHVIKQIVYQLDMLHIARLHRTEAAWKFANIQKRDAIYRCDEDRVIKSHSGNISSEIHDMLSEYGELRSGIMSTTDKHSNQIEKYDIIIRGIIDCLHLWTSYGGTPTKVPVWITSDKL